MAIETMQYVNIVGNLPDLDQTLLRCIKSEVFHPELSANVVERTSGFELLGGENPYAQPLKQLYDLAEDIHLTLGYREEGEALPREEAAAEVERVRTRVTDLSAQRRALGEQISQHEQAIVQIRHLQGLNVTFDDIFSMQFVKVRFGKLPYDSFPKLEFYDNKTFFFVPFDNDSEYYWGVYFAPDSKIAVIDDIFKSLYFERMWVPDYAHLEPEKALQNISDRLSQERERLAEVETELKGICQTEEAALCAAFTALKAASDTFGLRRYVAVVRNRFYLDGFVPEPDAKKLSDSLAGLEQVSCTFHPADANPSMAPPTKLKANWFTKPFEMFVGMYGLPSYHDFDPTGFVAFTYCLLFGIMFGDVGQGLAIMLIGWIGGKKFHFALGDVMIRLGAFSTVFGFVYGSVFGLEHLLDPMYHAMGFAEKPVEVFAPSTTTTLLLAAIFLGVMLIVAAMCINIRLGFQTKDIGRALFSNSGLAGLVFYFGVVIAVALLMLKNINVLNPVFIIFVIVIPLICMFFKDPLVKLCQRRKDLKPEDGVVGFILENFFEMFEYLLSYVSNTMSFLRVGGMVLSHAGMMSVVLTLSEMFSGGGSIVVMIIGNIFVMCLEGMIVGIQVLRLEFYEIFSRFYGGDGKPYEPAMIRFTKES